MSNRLLVTTALAVGVVALPGVANAQMVGRVFGGASMPVDTDVSYYGYDAEISAETGFVVGGALGFTQGDFLFEGEIAHRSADIDQVTIPGLGSYDVNGAELSATSFMANGWYHFPTQGNIGFYLGGGAGMSNVEASITGYSYDSTEFAWQLGAGLAFRAEGGFSYGVGYRYFNVPEVDDVEIDFSTHEVVFEIIKRF